MPTDFFADLVRVVSHSTGTGPFVLGEAVPGHRAFAGVVPVGSRFHYAIAGISVPSEWETGVGMIDASGQLIRTLVSASSANGAWVDFSDGLKTAALTVGSDWFADHASGQAGLAADLAARQPISTGHPLVVHGAVGDNLTVRRGSGWVNVPMTSLAWRGSNGRFDLAGPVAVPDGSAAAPALAFASDTSRGWYSAGAGGLGLTVGGAERLRVSTDGNIGIGTTAPSDRVEIAGNIVLSQGADRRVRIGSLSNYYYDLTSVGDNFQIRDAAGDAALVVQYPGRHVRPGSDNDQRLGTAGFRWSAIFSGTGTINTSDAREKDWRGGLNAAEQRAAQRIAREIGLFQWKDAIAGKGKGGARWHVGLSAQAVWAIMADEGLVDPISAAGVPGVTRYAFLCWDKYEDGARFGLRTDQLALFIAAAQDMRLAALEAAA